MTNPIPERALMHCVALFEKPENCTNSFLEAMQRRTPGIDVSQSTWASRSEPRPMAYGPMEWNGWRWQIVLDLHGLIPKVRELLQESARSDDVARMVRNHAMSALVFLVEAPPNSQPLDHIRALCRVAWSYIDAGAAGIAFPEGRTVWTREQLAEVDPEQIYGSHSQIFVSSHFAGPAVSSRRWVRTFGMHQFGLSDIACAVAADGVNGKEDIRAADKLMTMVPPYLIELGENIADGDTIEVDDSLWRVSVPHSNDPSLKSPLGVNVYTVDESVIA
jgi:hypothetical protein